MVGAAGVRLGETKEELIVNIGKPDFLQILTGAQGRIHLFHYTALVIWLTDGEITEINTKQGYKGSTPQGLTVGVPWRTLRHVYRRLTFHEEQNRWYSPGIDGLSFEIVRPPKEHEIPLNMPGNAKSTPLSTRNTLLFIASTFTPFALSS